MSDLFDAAFLKKLELLTLNARRAMAGQTRGEQRSTRHGSSVEFADYRQYAPGDDFRRIDWNAYARFDNVFLKLFREEEDLNVHVMVDASASMDFGLPNKFTYARRVAGALAYIALHNADRVSVYLLGRTEDSTVPVLDVTRGRRGRGAIFEVFDFLQQGTCEGAADLNGAVQYLLAGRAQPGIAAIISDFLLPDGYEGAVKRLAYEKFQPMLVHVMAPDEMNPDLTGDLRLTDSETGDHVDVSPTRRLIALYRKRLEAFRQMISAFAATHGTDYVFASTDTPFEDLVLRWMRAANMVT
ncbi:MAG: DUF58 domain-containing protein [Planctomycetota bacterium]